MQPRYFIVLAFLWAHFAEPSFAGNRQVKLPQFFICPDSPGTFKNISLIRQQYLIIDDAKFKAAQCSVWLNNSSATKMGVQAGVISFSKIFWSRMKLNESFPVSPVSGTGDALSAFIYKNLRQKDDSLYCWKIVLQPGVNHLSIDFGLNETAGLESEKDSMQWKILPMIPALVNHSSLEIDFQISLQKQLQVLAASPSTGWMLADTLLRYRPNGNFDSAEIGYAHLHSESLSANTISWEIAFQQLDEFNQKNFEQAAWKPFSLNTSNTAKNKSSWQWTWLALLIIPLLFFLVKRKNSPS